MKKRVEIKKGKCRMVDEVAKEQQPGGESLWEIFERKASKKENKEKGKGLC